MQSPQSPRVLNRSAYNTLAVNQLLNIQTSGSMVIAYQIPEGKGMESRYSPRGHLLTYTIMSLQPVQQVCIVITLGPIDFWTLQITNRPINLSVVLSDHSKFASYTGYRPA